MCGDGSFPNGFSDAGEGEVVMGIHRDCLGLSSTDGGPEVGPSMRCSAPAGDLCGLEGDGTPTEASDISVSVFFRGFRCFDSCRW
jgi:hypothetical protein